MTQEDTLSHGYPSLSLASSSADTDIAETAHGSQTHEPAPPSATSRQSHSNDTQQTWFLIQPPAHICTPFRVGPSTRIHAAVNDLCHISSHLSQRYVPRYSRVSDMPEEARAETARLFGLRYDGIDSLIDCACTLYSERADTQGTETEDGAGPARVECTASRTNRDLSRHALLLNFQDCPGNAIGQPPRTASGEDVPVEVMLGQMGWRVVRLDTGAGSSVADVADE